MEWHIPPEFEIGQVVYCIIFDDNCPAAMSGPRWKITTIRSIEAEVVKIGEELKVLRTGYIVGDLFVGKYGVVRPNEVYLDQEEIEKMCVWHPVTLSDQEWMQLAGDRGVEEEKLHPWEHHVVAEPIPISEAELGPCCAEISAARNILYKCAKHGGLIERDAQRLFEICEGHETDTTDMPLLKKVLKQLGKA